VLGRTRDTPTPQSRLTRLEQVVARHAENSSCDDRVVAALQEIAAVTEPNIEDVAWHVGWCGRQLRRRFQDVVGYGPKTFHRIVRLQRMLSLIRRSRGRIDLSGLAVDSGYADQAHMTREAVALAGQSPRALIAGTAHATLEMSELFNIQDAALR
jgi:transcriptional regulator GlxA family with amidase domain